MVSRLRRCYVRCVSALGAIIVLVLLVVADAVADFFSQPRRRLKHVASQQGWEVVVRDAETHVHVPAGGGTVTVRSWERPVATTPPSDATEQVWSTASTVNLPASFLSAHADAVADFLRDRMTPGLIELQPDDGSLRYTTTDLVTVRRVAQVVDGTRQAARQLDFGESDPMVAMRRLAQMPPTPVLAWASLAWTVEHDAHNPMLPQLLEAGLGSKHPQHRLVAARHVRDDRALKSMLQMVQAGGWPNRNRIEGLLVLLRHPALLAKTREQQLAMVGPLMSLIQKAQGELLRALLAAFDDNFGLKVPLVLLAKRMFSVDIQSRVALVKAMACHEEEAEPYLLNALKDQKPAVRIAALRALGRWGTPNVLGAVQQVSDKWTTIGAEDRAATEALLAIRVRHRHAIDSAGGLALSDAPAGEGGQLSETAEVGELALHEPA